MNHNHFKRGHGVYACGLCGRQTRGHGDAAGCELCGECYELCGMDNMVNDDGRLPTDAERKEAERLLAKLNAKCGRDMRASFTYLFAGA